MRIGILTQYFPPEIGAPQTRLADLAMRFVRRGHEVFVLTAMPNYPRGRIYPGYGGIFKKEEQEGIRIIRTCIYPTKSLRMLPRMVNYLSFVCSSAVIGMFGLPRLDFLLTESPPLFLGLSGYWLSRVKRARWIFNVSDLWPESAVQLGVASRESTLIRMAEALEAFCYKKAWLVTGQSREIVESVQRRFPTVQTYRLSNGVDTDRFRPRYQSSMVRSILADGRETVAVYAGLHGVAQGLEQILEAAQQLQDVDDFGIVFIGDGPEKEKLMQRSRHLQLNNVRFLPPYPREDMPEVMSAVDIALVPLKRRLPGAVPSKLYEAMGTGLPVVLMADGEPADVVTRAGAGCVVPPNNPVALAQTLRWLSRDKDACVRMGTHGRRAALEHYNREVIADAFIRLIEQAVDADM
ncbi:MAG: glycosyltransferase family 4 protein [Rhodothermales bacterium]